MSYLRSLAARVMDPALQSRWIAYVGHDSPLGITVESINPGLGAIGVKNRYAQGVGSNPYPDTVNFSAATMVFYEDHKYSTTLWLEQWRLQIFDPETGVFGVPSQYRRNINVKLFPVDSNTPVATLIMEDCWPATVGGFDYSYQNIEGRVVLQVDMQVNRTYFRVD